METQPAQPKKFSEEEQRRYQRWHRDRRSMEADIDALPKEKRSPARLDFMLWQISTPAPEETRH